MIVLLRVDDRLVHGQVVEGWLPELKVRKVLVVSAAAAADPSQRALMRLALPDEVALELVALQDGPRAARAAASSSERVLVLVPGPAEALALVRGGLRTDSVNVGGLHYAAGRIQLGKAIFLTELDLWALGELADAGVRLEGRAVPSDPPMDVAAMIRMMA